MPFCEPPYHCYSLVTTSYNYSLCNLWADCRPYAYVFSLCFRSVWRFVQVKDSESTEARHSRTASIFRTRSAEAAQYFYQCRFPLFMKHTLCCLFSLADIGKVVMLQSIKSFFFIRSLREHDGRWLLWQYMCQCIK